MTTRPQNWVFFGDSLTEGVGSRRISYVTELARKLRNAESAKPLAERTIIHEFRLRRVDPESFNRFLRVNVAATWDHDEEPGPSALWLWNFAAEGATVENDREWMPFLENLRPDRVFSFHGSLESVVRPAALRSGWPWWVPGSWRGYASMDPRCYFSTSWWRRAKQKAVDTLKQRIRLSLLKDGEGCTLVDEARFLESSREMFLRIRGLTEHLHVLGLLPIGNSTFPGSQERFDRVNRLLQLTALEAGASFLDWGVEMRLRMASSDLFYSDRFHPNQAGYAILADVLIEHLGSSTASFLGELTSAAPPSNSTANGAVPPRSHNAAPSC